MLKYRVISLLLAVSAGTFPALADAPPPPAQLGSQPGEEPMPPLQPANFDGFWQGRIKFDKEAFLVSSSTPQEGVPMRIEISGPVVHVFLENDHIYSEFMAGQFHIAQVMSNAVVFGSHAQDPWTESWVFVVTHRDDDTLLVNFVRVVNNERIPLSDINSKFSTRGFGEFTRITQ